MIGFPIKKTRTEHMNQKNFRKANLGMFLEDIINETNEYYLNKNLAIIHKKPTPVQIVKVDYPSRDRAIITEAYYKTPSTTDYNGVYRGKYIDFEAKETNITTSFSLNNVHAHQVSHLERIIEHGGIGFLIVYFKKLDEAYLLPFNILKEYWDKKETERKSIPYNVFVEKAYRINLGYLPKIDYLKTVDEVYF